jgi:hypothetical protein
MDGNPILDTLRQQLTPATIQRFSSELGADPATTSAAISTALPALLGGLASNAAHPEGAAALDRALAAHDGSVLDNIGSVFGGGGLGAAIGGKILGHIFGARRGPVEEGVGQASGLNPDQVTRLLAMLAPIVMGVLGRMRQKNEINPAQLPDVLNGGGTGDLPGMLGSVLGGLFNK